MKLDEGLNFQKQSLDLTPLIDIIFLLVLFFAVSTSFISGEDLQALKSDLATLEEQKASLNRELARTADVLNTTRSQLTQAEQRVVRLEDFTDELTRERDQARDRAGTLDARVAVMENERDRQRQRLQTLRSELDQASSRLARTRERARTLQASLAQRREQWREAEQALDQAAAERGRLEAELGNARGRVEHLEAELAEFRELAAVDREQLERMQAAQQALESNLDEVLQNNQLDIKREERNVILQLSDRILFDSGSAVIKEQGAEVLKDVGATIKSNLRGMRIQVAGHTDNVPITGGQGPYGDNWSLSAARAVNVLQLLEREVGIDPKLLSAVGYGEHQPVAGNDTAEGRARNRRIELVLVPLFEKGERD